MWGKSLPSLGLSLTQGQFWIDIRWLSCKRLRLNEVKTQNIYPGSGAQPSWINSDSHLTFASDCLLNTVPHLFVILNLG